MLECHLCTVDECYERALSLHYLEYVIYGWHLSTVDLCNAARGVISALSVYVVSLHCGCMLCKSVCIVDVCK